jgi:hypothetical protein
VLNPEVGEGLGEVGDEVVFVGSLDNHVIDVSLDVLADLRLSTSGWPSGRSLQHS